ncbi:hypothetical protein B566_EDAN013230 [Ephemera danica]|nr:hypothetical protein B566_EDAN013230 [Ephemera danica]
MDTNSSLIYRPIVAKVPVNSNTASHPTISENPIGCAICRVVCTNESLLFKHFFSNHTVNFKSMGSISYQRPFRFIPCKVKECMWKTKFLGVERRELISQFKIHAQINHNNMFVCEYCLGMFENREQFCDHNIKYHPKHKCEFSSSNGVCDCSATKQVEKGTICEVSGCNWISITTDQKQMLADIKQHMEMKHGELHACYFCFSIFLTAKQKHAHIIEKHMKSCNICDFKYVSHTTLMNHCHITHTVPNNIPMFCNLNIELKKKSTILTFCQVEDCNFSTKSEDPEQIVQDLKFHCSMLHKGVEVCDRCFEMFPSLEELDSHVDEVHVYQCNICNCAFKTPKTLYGHCKSQHQVPSNWNSEAGCIDSEKQNVPEMCNGSVTSFVGIQMVRKCLICDCTLYKNSLFSHNVTYHMVSTDIDMSQVNFTTPLIRKLQCKKCLLVFTRLYDLKVHYLNTHSIKLLCSETGSTRTFSCTVCDEPLRTRKLEYIQHHYQYAHHQEFDTDLLDFSKWYNPILNEQSSCEGSLVFHCKLCTDLCTSLNELMLHYKYAHTCYACVKCKTVFETEEHKMLHWNEVHFVACKLCDFKAEFGQTLIRHMMSSHNQVVFDNRPITSKNTKSDIHCNLCPDHLLSNKRNAKMHYFWFHNKYTCEYCWQTFHGANAEHKHVLDNHMTECIHCNRTLDDLKSLETHLSSVHQNEKCNICESCGEFLNDRNALKLHRESHKNQSKKIVKSREHKKKPIFLCSKCGSTFHEKKLYDRHMANVHPVSEVNCGNFCKLCNKKYKNIMLHKYISHKEIYAKENGPKNCKMLECSFCKKKVHTISELLRHMERHSKYKCKQCPMQYSLLLHLEEHVTELHTNRYAYSCTVCSKLCATEADFNLHTSFHSADSQQNRQPDLLPVLRCDLCDHLCLNRDSMQKHVRTRHIKSGKLINVKRKKPIGRKPYIKRVF